MEIFVIPYFLWFAYIFVTVAYFFFKDRGEKQKIFTSERLCSGSHCLCPAGIPDVCAVCIRLRPANRNDYIEYPIRSAGHTYFGLCCLRCADSLEITV